MKHFKFLYKYPNMLRILTNSTYAICNKMRNLVLISISPYQLYCAIPKLSHCSSMPLLLLGRWFSIFLNVIFVLIILIRGQAHFVGYVILTIKSPFWVCYPHNQVTFSSMLSSQSNKVTNVAQGYVSSSSPNQTRVAQGYVTLIIADPKSLGSRVCYPHHCQTHVAQG